MTWKKNSEEVREVLKGLIIIVKTAEDRGGDH